MKEPLVLRMIKVCLRSALAMMLIFMLGCAKYKPQRIDAVRERRLVFATEKEKIKLVVRALEQDQFDGPFEKYQILHFKITNKTGEAFWLNSKNISLPVTSLAVFDKERSTVYIKYLLPSAIFFVGGLFFWWQIGLPIAGLLGLSAFQFSASENKKIKKKLSDVALDVQHDLAIQAHSTIDVLVFIKKKDYRSAFQLALVTTDQQRRIAFDVSIRSRIKTVYVMS